MFVSDLFHDAPGQSRAASEQQDIVSPSISRSCVALPVPCISPRDYAYLRICMYGLANEARSCFPDDATELCIGVVRNTQRGAFWKSLDGWVWHQPYKRSLKSGAS